VVVVMGALLVLTVVLTVGVHRWINERAKAERSQGHESVWAKNIGTATITGWRRTVSLAAGAVGLLLVLAGFAVHGLAETILLSVGLVVVVVAYGVRTTAR
jgi:hypothetical protein